jgi:hypothetical protein
MIRPFLQRGLETCCIGSYTVNLKDVRQKLTRPLVSRRVWVYDVAHTQNT